MWQKLVSEFSLIRNFTLGHTVASPLKGTQTQSPLTPTNPPLRYVQLCLYYNFELACGGCMACLDSAHTPFIIKFRRSLHISAREVTPRFLRLI